MMLIEGLLQASRESLVTLAEDARLIDAARFLSSGTDLVVVCNGDGILQGVVTKTDVVQQISTCQAATCLCPVGTVMSRDIVLCRASDHLADVSKTMKRRHLKNIPVVDAHDRPIGALTARIILRALLKDSEYTEFQLIDYVAGVGYR